MIDNESYTYGVYEVNFTIDGEKTSVVIDDMIATDEYFPAFASGKLWVVLLEKAWAKIHGCYNNIEGDAPFVRSAHKTFTGHFRIDDGFDEPDIDFKKLETDLLKLDQKDAIFTVANCSLSK